MHGKSALEELKEAERQLDALILSLWRFQSSSRAALQSLQESVRTDLSEGILGCYKVRDVVKSVQLKL